MDESRTEKEAGKNSRRWRRILYAVLSVGVTIGIMGYLFRRRPPGDILRKAADIDRRALLCFMVLSFGQVFFRTWRYQLLLRNIGVRVGNIAMLLTTIIRNLFSDLLPARIGTLSYIYIVTERLGVPFESAASSFTLAFLFDLIVMAPLVLTALLVAGGAAGLSIGRLAVLAVALFSLMALILWALPQLFGFAGRLVARIKKSKFRQLSERLEQAGRQVRQTRRAGLYVRLLVLSFLVRICKYGAIYFLVFGWLKQYGHRLSELSIARVFLGMSAAELAASTPISGIAGFGAYEGVWSFTFKMLKFSAMEAEETGIVVHMITQIWGYGLGAAALMIMIMPFFGKRRSVEKDVMKKPASIPAFIAKAAAAVLVLAVITSAVMRDTDADPPATLAGDVPTPEEEQVRRSIAEEIEGRILFDSRRLRKFNPDTDEERWTFGVYTMSPDGTDEKIVVDTEAHEMYPSASPDGKLIAYARYRRLAKRAASEIWLVNVDGTEARMLVSDGTFPSFSSDGKRVYFERRRSRLMAIDLDGKGLEQLLPKKRSKMAKYQLVKPRVSPDGKWAAFITDRKGRWNVWFANIETGEAKWVGGGCEPAWFPNSSKLVWITQDPPDTAINKYDLASGKRSKFHDAGIAREMEYFPSISPDGRYAFFSAAPGASDSGHETANYQIYVKPLDGRKAVRLTFDRHNNRWPSLLPEQK